MDQFSDTEEDEENAKRRLSGKSRDDKRRILAELENVKQMEIQMNYKMERQQLRHDARMAQQKIGEHNRAQEMLDAMTNKPDPAAFESDDEDALKTTNGVKVKV